MSSDIPLAFTHLKRLNLNPTSAAPRAVSRTTLVICILWHQSNIRHANTTAPTWSPVASSQQSRALLAAELSYYLMQRIFILPLGISILATSRPFIRTSNAAIQLLAFTGPCHSCATLNSRCSLVTRPSRSGVLLN
jgi:hypothetical protein